MQLDNAPTPTPYDADNQSAKTDKSGNSPVAGDPAAAKDAAGQEGQGVAT